MGQQSRESWRLLLHECARSSGIVTAARAGVLGVEPRELRRLAEKGSLVRESRGIYRLAGCPLGQAQRLVIAKELGGVISHETGAELWGFDLDDPVTHIAVRHGFGLHVPRWMTVHETRHLSDELISDLRGIPVTNPLRTLLDLAARPISDERYLAFVNHCIAERLVTPASLTRYVSLRGGFMKGVVRLRTLLEGLNDVGSRAEAELVALLIGAGVDRPETQFVVRDGADFVGRVDLAWPARRVALELDGYRHHSDPESFVRDRERGNRIVLLGWSLLRTTPATVRRRPHVVIAEVRAALAREGAA